MEVSDAKRLRELETENSKLKRLYADAMLDERLLSSKAVTQFLRNNRV